MLIETHTYSTIVYYRGYFKSMQKPNDITQHKLDSHALPHTLTSPTSSTLQSTCLRLRIRSTA